MCRKGWEKGGRLSKVSYPKSFGGNKVDNKAKRNELKLLKLLLLPQPVQNLWFRALSVLVCTSVPTQAHLEDDTQAGLLVTVWAASNNPRSGLPSLAFCSRSAVC